MAELTWHQAIQQVLAANGRPMHTDEITEQIIEKGLRTAYGATPQATVGAQLAASVRRRGAESPYVRVDKATYILKSLLADTPASAADTATDEPDATLSDSDNDGLVNAFGMFWQRDSVFWTSTPAVLGRERIGATAVDFSPQRGIYLLHDGREVVYVGRSVDRPLGRRLYEHTQDRLRARWDRFSWFGFLKVTEEGGLSEVSCALSPDLTAATLEAVLIEGLEPRQNRKRGDGFNGIEYLQADDPEVERVQMQQLLATVQDKLAQR